MITLSQLYEIASLPMVDMETKKEVNGLVVLNNPDAIVEKIACDDKFNILVKYKKEPANEEDD